MQKLAISELNQIYNDSESIDAEIYAHQRTNVLLFVGEHYQNMRSKFWDRVREAESVDSTTRLRIVKNHIQKICLTYINNIIQYCPTTCVTPKNKNEMQDRKRAKLHQLVWQDIKDNYNIPEFFEQLVTDFIIIGECWYKIAYEYDSGPVVGVEVLVGDDGKPQLNEDGTPVTRERRNGRFIFERIYGFDLLRDKSAKSIPDSRVMIYRKMVDIKDLKATYPEHEEEISETNNDTFKIFDGMNGKYSESKNQTMVREYYFRPCADYPNGYYYITTESIILTEGELPLGIFPIDGVGFNSFPTSPRAHSIIKTARPYQIEVNRCASSIAEHQITLGSDKLLVQRGTKLASGAYLPGIRGIQYTGLKPEVIPGRSGSQYLEYLNSNITEMYANCNLVEDSMEKNKATDPYMELFQAIKDKKKFIVYSNKIERLFRTFTEKALAFSKAYYDENYVIKAIGTPEAVNIKEYKSMEPIGYEIKIESSTEDYETRLGRILTFREVIQYLGGALKPEQMGIIIKNLPYGDSAELAEEFTINHDMAENDILALDRGEIPISSPNEDHEYMIQKLTLRMKKGDFRLLDPKIQQNYNQKLTEHENILAAQQQAIENSHKGMIPAGGFLVTVNATHKEPMTGKIRRIKIPSDSLIWMLEKLEQQGALMAQAETLPTGVQAQMAALGQGMQQQAPQQPGPFPQGPMMGMSPPTGEEIPEGELQ